jgi:murein DD-endopeptidase MepM/ murein hydrolase activator NlpD
VLTGRGEFRHYVEFDVLPGESLPVGGAKRLLGLGRYQEFVPGQVGLAGRAPEFGVLAPNPGQRFVAPAATVVVVAGTGYVIYEAFDDD